MALPDEAHLKPAHPARGPRVFSLASPSWQPIDGMNPPRELPFRIRASIEELLLAAAVFWLLAGNQSFLREALLGRSLASGGGLQMAATLVLAVVAMHVLLLGLVAERRSVKPLLAVLTLITALASWFTSRYGIVLDPTMLRNVLRTDVAEASELLGWALFILNPAVPSP